MTNLFFTFTALGIIFSICAFVTFIIFLARESPAFGWRLGAVSAAFGYLAAITFFSAWILSGAGYGMIIFVSFFWLFLATLDLIACWNLRREQLEMRKGSDKCTTCS